MLLNAEIENLNEGDIKLWDYDNPEDCALFERKLGLMLIVHGNPVECKNKCPV